MFASVRLCLCEIKSYSCESTYTIKEILIYLYSAVHLSKHSQPVIKFIIFEGTRRPFLSTKTMSTEWCRIIALGLWGCLFQRYIMLSSSCSACINIIQTREQLLLAFSCFDQIGAMQHWILGTYILYHSAELHFESSQ